VAPEEDPPGVGLTAGALAAPDAADPDDADLYLHQSDLERGGLTVRRPGAPPHSLRLGWGATLDTHGDTDLAADAPQHRRDTLTRSWRYVTHANTAAQTRRRFATTATRETLLAEKADAEALAAFLGPLLTAEHEVVEVSIPARPFRLPLHARVWLDAPDFGIGAAYRLLGIRESQADTLVRLKLWRPLPPEGTP
jgi:hypothetical protein